jgi:hypothetical protein
VLPRAGPSPFFLAHAAVAKVAIGQSNRKNLGIKVVAPGMMHRRWPVLFYEAEFFPALWKADPKAPK